MSELKQIAKQVSLLNRLIELLMMQESKPDLGIIKQFNWYPVNGFDGYQQWSLVEGSYVKTIDEAWNHPITQKAWSDELVKVVKELYGFECTDLDFAWKNERTTSYSRLVDFRTVDLRYLVESLFFCFYKVPGYEKHSDLDVRLEAILNKYNRTLNK